jgi:beta-glucanase (GH16 family)
MGVRYSRLPVGVLVLSLLLWGVTASVNGIALSDHRRPPPTTTTTTPRPTTTTTSTTTSTTSTTTTTIQPGGPALLFDDEFNGTVLDTKKWSKGWLATGITPPVNASESQCYDPNQATVANGELALSLVAKPETCGGVTRPFASGIVNSYATFRFTYGYAEARIWFPAGSGVWPAWWTDGHTWPNDGEIDIVEAYGTDTHLSYHYHYAGCGGVCGPGGQNSLLGATTGWHTYAVNWQPGSITWYYDGQLVWSFTDPAVTSSWQYLILNLATNSTSATVPSVMRVDYVRVYASKP